jgi:hypothetical protein
MVASVAVITVVIFVIMLIISPKFFHTKKNTFVNQANNLVKAAINKYTNDSNEDDGYPDDIYEHSKSNDEHFGKICYNINSLKGKYVKKIDDSYQGSIEICTLSSCEYKTKIWLSNDEFYINGHEGNVKKSSLTTHVLGISRCGNVID